MGNKFKIGDRVRIVSGKHAGESGTVEVYRFNSQWPYQVALDSGTSTLFCENQIELVSESKPTFKIGDRVRDLGGVVPQFKGIATIVEAKGPNTFVVRCSEGHLRGRYASEIELVSESKPDFKVGDRVKIKTGSCTGQFATVRAIVQQSCWPFTVHGDDGHHYAYAGDSLELVADEPLLSDAEQDALKNAARADWKNWATRVIAHGGSTQYGKTEATAKAVGPAKAVARDWKAFCDRAVAGWDKALGPDWTAVVEVKAVGPDEVAPFGKQEVEKLEQVLKTSQAMRFNEGKPELSYLLTFGDALREFAKVCAYGAAKYERANYTKGAPLSQSMDCLLRHLLKWNEGEDRDPESGQLHLAHVVWNALRLCQEAIVRPDLDDRISYQHRQKKADNG